MKSSIEPTAEDAEDIMSSARLAKVGVVGEVAETPAQDGSDIVWRTCVGEFRLECAESICRS